MVDLSAGDVSKTYLGYRRETEQPPRAAAVMATRDEIEETLAAYQSGRFGTIPALEPAT